MKEDLELSAFLQRYASCSAFFLASSHRELGARNATVTDDGEEYTKLSTKH